MPVLTSLSRPYMVTILDRIDEDKEELVFTFVPQSDPNHSQFIVWVNCATDTLDWSHTLHLPGDARAEIEEEIRRRLDLRTEWITRVEAVAGQIEGWARRAEWSTRRIPFRLDDSLIGRHSLPAILMQKDTCRILFEPVTRSSPGADGVIDIYLLPEYDDIASIYYYDNHWNLHYMFAGTPTVATIRDADSVELTADSLQRVLSEMQQNAEAI